MLHVNLKFVLTVKTPLYIQNHSEKQLDMLTYQCKTYKTTVKLL